MNTDHDVVIKNKGHQINFSFVFLEDAYTLAQGLVYIEVFITAMYMYRFDVDTSTSLYPGPYDMILLETTNMYLRNIKLRPLKT